MTADSQKHQGDEQSQRDICRAYGIPPWVAGIGPRPSRLRRLWWRLKNR